MSARRDYGSRGRKVRPVDERLDHNVRVPDSEKDLKPPRNVLRRPLKLPAIERVKDS